MTSENVVPPDRVFRRWLWPRIQRLQMKPIVIQEICRDLHQVGPKKQTGNARRPSASQFVFVFGYTAADRAGCPCLTTVRIRKQQQWERGRRIWTTEHWKKAACPGELHLVSHHADERVHVRGIPLGTQVTRVHHGKEASQRRQEDCHDATPSRVFVRCVWAAKGRTENGWDLQNLMHGQCKYSVVFDELKDF